MQLQDGLLSSCDILHTSPDYFDLARPCDEVVATTCSVNSISLRVPLTRLSSSYAYSKLINRLVYPNWETW